MPIHKVLIVDDSKTEVMFLTDLLQKNGFVVRSAENADEAFKRLSEEKPDLILMDVQMPEVDGLQATEQIRRIPRHLHTPIVAMTANVFGDDRQACLAAGMNDFLTKPVLADRLLSAIERWTGQRGSWPTRRGGSLRPRSPPQDCYGSRRSSSSR